LLQPEEVIAIDAKFMTWKGDVSGSTATGNQDVVSSQPLLFHHQGLWVDKTSKTWDESNTVINNVLHVDIVESLDEAVP
jgi:hypothetical protein